MRDYSDYAEVALRQNPHNADRFSIPFLSCCDPEPHADGAPRVYLYCELFVHAQVKESRFVEDLAGFCDQVATHGILFIRRNHFLDLPSHASCRVEKFTFRTGSSPKIEHGLVHADLRHLPYDLEHRQ